MRIAPRGLYSIIERDGADFLVAALDGRFVTGELTPVLSAILCAEDPPATARLALAEIHGERATDELRALGLIA